jgi:hypothetical protein
VWCVFIIVKFLKLVLVDRGNGDDDNARVLSSRSGVLDDLLQVLFVDFQGHMLIMALNTCIVCTEKYGLREVSIIISHGYLWVRYGGRSGVI